MLLIICGIPLALIMAIVIIPASLNISFGIRDFYVNTLRKIFEVNLPHAAVAAIQCHAFVYMADGKNIWLDQAKRTRILIAYRSDKLQSHLCPVWAQYWYQLAWADVIYSILDLVFIVLWEQTVVTVCTVLTFIGQTWLSRPDQIRETLMVFSSLPKCANTQQIFLSTSATYKSILICLIGPHLLNDPINPLKSAWLLTLGLLLDVTLYEY